MSLYASTIADRSASHAPTTPSLVYLDHHATTPVHPDVWSAMHLMATELFYNPSGTHAGSLAVQAHLQDADETVRTFLRTPASSHVVYTAGATEANNLALLGFSDASGVAVSTTEHKSVLETAASAQLRSRTTLLPVDRFGHVDLGCLEAALRGGVRLVSVMAVNNEIGTVARAAEVARLCEQYDVLFHCDATQAIDNQRFDLERLPIDLLSLSAHKIYGPKGSGALVISERALERFQVPHTFGGGQQLGLRAGTEHVPGIVGLAAALRRSSRQFDQQIIHRQAMRDALLRRLEEHLEITVNGDPLLRHPGNLHVSFHGVVAQRLFAQCAGLAFSTGSACNSHSNQGSHVLRAIGLDPHLVGSSMRLSVGETTTLADIERAAEIIVAACRVARA